MHRIQWTAALAAEYQAFVRSFQKEPAATWDLEHISPRKSSLRKTRLGSFVPCRLLMKE